MGKQEDGVVTKVRDGVYDLRFERRIAVPVDKVWAALTIPERLADWLAVATVDLRMGGTIELIWTEMGERNVGTIVELDPPRLLTFTWSEPDGAPGSVVRWELTEEAGGCRLMMTNTLLRAAHLLDVGTGWHSLLDALPAAAMRAEPRPMTPEYVRQSRARQAALIDRYRAKLPPDAAEVEWIEWKGLEPKQGGR
jgi:uncharacterized protein YndB with AHSA1/START domain